MSNRGICKDFFMYFIQHSFICCPSDSTVSYDDGLEPRTVATLLMAVRRSFWWAKNTSKFQEEEKVPILRHTGRTIASGSGTDPDPREFETRIVDGVDTYT